MKRARFIAQARQEFFDEIHYYKKIHPQLSLRFVSAVEEATRRAIEFPDAGSISEAGTRFVITANFPFSIIYRAVENGIIVFAVAHQSRAPNYWSSRIKT
jgi:plasmid stabilization system protein ParE